jgi:polyhydroxyalkanoate synthase
MSLFDRLPSVVGLLKANNSLFEAANNAFDWVFLRESLIKSGKTPYREIFQQGPMALRFYPRPQATTIPFGNGEVLAVQQKSRQVPIILVPPLGVTTEAFDLMPTRSLARFFSAAGYPTYLIDWGKPGAEDAHLGLIAYSDEMLGAAIAKVRTHSGNQEVSLMGWCMGGLLILLQSGFSGDKDIKNIVLVASPINLRGSGLVARSASVLNMPAKLIRKYSSLRLHMIEASRFAMPDWATTLAFKLTDPVGSVSTYWDLITRLWDREFVENHSTTSDYLNNMLLYPGGVVQDMMVSAAIDNQFASGKIKIRGREADLTSITANMRVFAGATDTLVSADTAERIIQVVSSKDTQFSVVPGGHMGAILGSNALDNVWRPVAEWLGSRSGEFRGTDDKSAMTRDTRNAHQQESFDSIF